MRPALFIASLLFAVSPAFAQSRPAANDKSQVKEELRALFDELNAALAKRDRQSLERIYADEFLWIHGAGYIDNKTAHLDETLSIDVINPVPVPTFDDLFVYGDVAIFRVTGRSKMVNSLYGTTIFAKANGRWQIVQIQGTAMLPQRKSIKVEARVLDACVWKVRRKPGRVFDDRARRRCAVFAAARHS